MQLAAQEIIDVIENTGMTSPTINFSRNREGALRVHEYNEIRKMIDRVINMLTCVYSSELLCNSKEELMKDSKIKI